MNSTLSPTNQGLIATFIFMVIILVVLLTAMAYLTWAERKVLAKMQDRYGPTRTGPAGLLQPLADGIKLLAKEDVVPANADRYLFLFAPLITFVTAFASFAVIPFGLEVLTIPFTDKKLSLFIADVNIGVLYILALSGMGVYGIVLGGYASGNRYSLLGGLRSAASTPRTPVSASRSTSSASTSTCWSSPPSRRWSSSAGRRGRSSRGRSGWRSRSRSSSSSTSGCAPRCPASATTS